MVERGSICRVARIANSDVIRPLTDSVRPLLFEPVTDRPRIVVTPDKLSPLHPLLFALSTVESRLIDKDLYLFAASLFIDYGKEVASPYHSDVWVSAPFQNHVLQLWLPLACHGNEADIRRSMLRVDRKNKVEDNWGVPYGIPEYCQLYTGERRSLPFATDLGCLASDPDGIKDELVGGEQLEVGDVLCFDSSFCHYTLPSRALRAGLSLRFTWGPPTYSGYFLQTRPFDGLTGTEVSRQAQADVCEGFKAGDMIPQPLLRRRGAFCEYPQNHGGSKFADALLDAIALARASGP